MGEKEKGGINYRPDESNKCLNGYHMIFTTKIAIFPYMAKSDGNKERGVYGDD